MTLEQDIQHALLLDRWVRRANRQHRDRIKAAKAKLDYTPVYDLPEKMYIGHRWGPRLPTGERFTSDMILVMRVEDFKELHGTIPDAKFRLLSGFRALEKYNRWHTVSDYFSDGRTGIYHMKTLVYTPITTLLRNHTIPASVLRLHDYLDKSYGLGLNLKKWGET